MIQISHLASPRTDGVTDSPILIDDYENPTIMMKITPWEPELGLGFVINK